MAGDWIKMRGNLWDDPRVSALVDATDSSEAAVVGALYWLWATADQHTEDGVMPGLTLRQIDRKTGVTGFAAALVAIGWIADHPEGVRIINFEEHNGASAKKRCSTAKRVAIHRTGNDDVTHTTLQEEQPSVTTALAREEKRREDKKKEGEGSSPNGSRIPADWQMDAEDREYCRTTRPDLDPDAVSLDFVQHWKNTPGAKGRKLNWRLTWQVWVRGQFAKKQSPFAKPEMSSTVPSRQERDPELTRLDIERTRAVPMPAAFREKLTTLKFGIPA